MFHMCKQIYKLKNATTAITEKKNNIEKEICRYVPATVTNGLTRTSTPVYCYHSLQA